MIHRFLVNQFVLWFVAVVVWSCRLEARRVRAIWVKNLEHDDGFVVVYWVLNDRLRIEAKILLILLMRYILKHLGYFIVRSGFARIHLLIIFSDGVADHGNGLKFGRRTTLLSAIIHAVICQWKYRLLHFFEGFFRFHSLLCAGRVILIQ